VFSVVYFELSIPVQVIAWKDSSLKWPIMCWAECKTLTRTHSCMHSLISCIDMHVASFKHSLLSVDMDVCMWLCVYVNTSETKGDSRLFPIESL